MMRQQISTVLLIIIIIGCESSNQKIQQDINSHKIFFKENQIKFKTIEKCIDSLINIRYPITDKQFSNIINSKIKLTNKPDNNLFWQIKIDSLSSGNFLFRFAVNIQNVKSHCSEFNYCYAINNKDLDLITNTKRNISYESLSKNWLLEVDSSSPCID